MAKIINNNFVTDKFGRTSTIEPTIIASSNAEDIVINVNSGTPIGTSTTVPIPDFWRASTGLATDVPTALGSFTAKAQNNNDTTKNLQHNGDLFIGGANGLIRLGNGKNLSSTNIVFSQNALKVATTAIENVFIGNGTTGQMATTASGNVVAGFGAFENGTVGLNNLVMGKGAGYYVGNAAGSNNNVLLGLNAGYWGRGSNFKDNVYVGNGAGSANGALGGQYNIGLGSCLNNVNNASHNIAAGYYSQLSGSNQTNCISIGNSSLYSNTNFNHIISIGRSSNYYNNGGSETVTLGSDASGWSLINDKSVQVGVNSNQWGKKVYNSVSIGHSSAKFNDNNNLSTIGTESSFLNARNNNTALGYRANYNVGTVAGGVVAMTVTSTSQVTFNNSLPVGSVITIATNSCANSIRNGSSYIVLNSTTIEKIGPADLVAGEICSNITYYVQKFDYSNSTALGANSQNTLSNQIALGDTNVVELLMSGKLVLDINAIFGAADGTPVVVKTVGGRKTITI
jgi:hypothetical protein